MGNLAKQSLSSILTHAVTPIAMPLLWLVALRDGMLRWRDIVVVMLLPVTYLGQMFVRGMMLDGFTYPQVDITRVGWGGALTFSGAVLLLFFVIGLMVIALDGMLRSRADAAR